MIYNNTKIKTIDINKKIKSNLKIIINNNPEIYSKYKKGNKGLIGFFINEIIKISDISYITKKDKQELILTTKKILNS